jgi:chromosome segregation ATPase
MSDQSKLDQILNRIEDLNKSYHDLDKRLAVVATSLEGHFKEDVTNMTRTARSLEAIDRLLDENVRQLTIHIQGVEEARKQNNLLQRQVEVSEQAIDLRLDEQQKDIELLKKPFIVVKGILWLVGALSAIGALILLFRNLH